MPVVIDGRNLLDPERMKGKRLEYYEIGCGLSAGGSQSDCHLIFPFFQPMLLVIN